MIRPDPIEILVRNQAAAHMNAGMPPGAALEQAETTVATNKRWSWPHIAFESKQQWREVMLWWTFPRDSAAYLEGRARAEAEAKDLEK